MKKFISIFLAVIMILGTLAPSASAVQFNGVQENPYKGYIELEGYRDGDFTYIKSPEKTNEKNLFGLRSMGVRGKLTYTFELDLSDMVDDVEQLDIRVTDLSGTFIEIITLTKDNPIQKREYDYVPGLSYANPNVVDDITVFFKDDAEGQEYLFSLSRIANAALRAQWFTNTSGDIKYISFDFFKEGEKLASGVFDTEPKTVTVLSDKDPYYLPKEYYDGFKPSSEDQRSINTKIMTISNQLDFDDYSTDFKTSGFGKETVEGDKIKITTDKWYFYDIIGSVKREGFQYNIREILKVKFNSGEGKFGEAGPNAVSSESEIGHSEKLSKRSIAAPAVEPPAGKKLSGWKANNKGDLITPEALEEQVVTADTEFFAQYEKDDSQFINVNITGGPDEGIKNFATLPKTVNLPVGTNWSPNIEKEVAPNIELNEGYAIYNWTKNNAEGAEKPYGEALTDGETLYANVKKKVIEVPDPTVPTPEGYIRITFHSDYPKEDKGYFGPEENKLDKIYFDVLKGTLYEEIELPNVTGNLGWSPTVVFDSGNELNQAETNYPGYAIFERVKGKKVGEEVEGLPNGLPTEFTATYTKKMIKITVTSDDGATVATEDNPFEVQAAKWETFKEIAESKLELKPGYEVVEWRKVNETGPVIKDTDEFGLDATVYAITKETVIEGTDPEDPVPEGYTRVEFFADEASKTGEAVKGTLKSTKAGSTNTAVKYLYYDVKDGLTFKEVPVPTITAKDGNTVKAEPKNWAPALPEKTAVVKELTEKQFVGQYESATVIPYEPTDPENPTDPEDPKIPTEDEDGNTVDKDEYVIIGYNTDGNGKLKKTAEDTTGVAALSFLIKKDTKWNDEKVQATLPGTIANAGYEFKEWYPELPNTEEAVVDKSVFKATFVEEETPIDPDIIGPVDPDNPDPTDPEKPEDYVTVTFEKGLHGEIAGKRVYYVNPVAKKTIGDLAKPAITPNDGYTHTGWDVADSVVIDKDMTVTALYEKLGTGGPTDPDPNPVDPTPSVPNDDQDTEEPDNKPEIEVIFGEDRIGTAIEVSKRKFGEADTVIIARHDVFADALVAGPLAYALDAPILLTRPTELMPEVKAEIERLGANHIIIVGGLASIDENVEEALRAIDPDLERLEGPTRYETSVKVADRLKEANGGRTTAVIATGVTYPDALSVGPFAAVEGMPILLVKPQEIPEMVGEAFDRLGIQEIYIAGGEASVGEELESQMPRLITRFSGQDRYATAVEIAKATRPNAKHIYIASGEVFPDALVAGPAAAKENAPILLSRRNVVPEILKDYIDRLSLDKITIVGGENTITRGSIESLFE